MEISEIKQNLTSAPCGHERNVIKLRIYSLCFHADLADLHRKIS
jgi:hypothetical protein